MGPDRRPNRIVAQEMAGSKAQSQMKTDLISIALFALAAILGAIGQFLYKSGADKASDSLWGYVANVRILTGVVCYVAVMVLFVGAFWRGGSPAVLYPVYASTFIWAEGLIGDEQAGSDANER